MATLYWRGAVNNNVQTTSNWTLTRPGLTASVPPAANSGPTAGDTVIFANFGSGWNPVYGPAGLIGAGITHTVLNQLIVEETFGRDIGGGTEANFLQAYAGSMFLRKGIKNIDSPTPFSAIVNVKSLNSSCPINLSPRATASDRVNYTLTGSASGLNLTATSNPARCNIYLGVESDQAITLSGGINTDSANKFNSSIYFGRFCTLGGLNRFIINGSESSHYLNFSRGISFSNLSLEHNTYAIPSGSIRAQFTMNGTTYGTTGPQGPISAITNLNISSVGGAFINSAGIEVDLFSGISCENVTVSGKSIVTAYVDSEKVFFKNLNYEFHPLLYTDSANRYFPIIYSTIGDGFIVGAANEVGGASIITPFGITSDKAPSILLSGSYEIDIV